MAPAHLRQPTSNSSEAEPALFGRAISWSRHGDRFPRVGPVSLDDLRANSGRRKSPDSSHLDGVTGPSFGTRTKLNAATSRPASSVSALRRWRTRASRNRSSRERGRRISASARLNGRASLAGSSGIDLMRQAGSALDSCSDAASACRLAILPLVELPRSNSRRPTTVLPLQHPRCPRRRPGDRRTQTRRRPDRDRLRAPR